MNNGGPAFPAPVCNAPLMTSGMVNIPSYPQAGMTLRDWFAGQVIAGMSARDTYDSGQATPQQRAALAYREADAMLAERSK